MPKPTVFTDMRDLEAARGQRVGESDWLTVTQELIDAFAEVTNDHQWIHVDAERARRESPLGTTIAHGLLTLSLLPSFSQQCVAFTRTKMSLNYGFDRVRFVSPVPVGSQVRGVFTIEDIRPIADGAQITWLVEVELREGARPALSARWLTRVLFATEDTVEDSGAGQLAR